MNRPYGMAQPAFSAYITALYNAQISPTRVIQTIGNAPASAGTHAQDGVLLGAPYCAAVDIHVLDLTTIQIRNMCEWLSRCGFAAFYRNPGSDGWPRGMERHCHAVYAGVPMKLSLRSQIHDFLHGRNGLASHGFYTFIDPEPGACDRIRALFLAHNPENN